MSALLAGRRGVVLGVSSVNSLGYAIAKALRAHGADVAVTCRPAKLAAVTPLAAAIGATTLPLDVDDEPSMARAFESLAARLDALDFLVHTIVSVPPALLAGPLVDVPRADFERVLAVGAWSLVAACRHARPLLARSPAPRVVALTSAGGHRMTPHYHVAGIAKAALESAVRYLALELGPQNILVNAVGGSLVATDGAMRTIGEAKAHAARGSQTKRSATRRPVELDDIAASVAYLCSPLARNVTGEVVTVDGGFAHAYL